MALSLMGFKGWWSELLTSCLGATKPALESIAGRRGSMEMHLCFGQLYANVYSGVYGEV